MKITYLEKEQIWQEERTFYYFDVDGSSYAIADDQGQLTLLDDTGYPIEPHNDHDNILQLLMPRYEAAREE